MSPREGTLIKAPRVPKRQERSLGKLEECPIARSMPRASEETLTLMEGKTW